MADMNDLGLSEFGMGGTRTPTPRLSDFSIEQLLEMSFGRSPIPSGISPRDISQEIFTRRTRGELRNVPQMPRGAQSPGDPAAYLPPTAAPASTTTPSPAPTPGTTGAPLPPPPRPDPLQGMIDKLLSPGRGGGSPIPNIPRVDVEKLKGEIPKVGEREAQETYKADPYMTMLQTGLRILAAKPELGQSPISAIAAPVGEGVKEYRGEKEKERTSKREEAEAARADKYRQAEAARSTTALGLQATTANQQAAYHEAQLRQSAAQHGETASLKRLELLITAEERRAKASLDRAMEEYYHSRDPRVIINTARPLETRRAEIEARLREQGVSEAEKQTLNSEMGRIDRDLGTLRGTLRAETTAGAGLDRAQIAGLFSVYNRGVGNPMAQQDPEYRAAVAKLREMGLLPSIPDPNAALPR